MNKLLKILFFSVMFTATYFTIQCYGGDSGEMGAFFRSNNISPTVSQEESDLITKVMELSQQSPQDAIKAIKSEITSSSNPAFDFVLGSLFFQIDELDAAEEAYKEAIRKHPNFSRARANLAHVLLKQDKIDEAIEEFKMVLLGGNPRPSTLTLMGYTFLLRDEPIPAETAYRQAILLESDDMNAYLGLAKSLLLQGRNRESIKLLAQILEKYPRRKELWFLSSNAYLALDEPDEAIADLECARRLDVATPESLATLGDLYLNRNQPEEALTVYEEAFSVEEPSIGRMLRAVEGFLMLRDTSKALVFIEKAKHIEQTGTVPFTPGQVKKLRFFEARQAHIKGDFDAADIAYKRLLKQDPLNGDALLCCGDLYRAQKKLEEALIYYERAERVSNKTVASLLRQAQVEVERSRYARAVELLESAQGVKAQPFVERYLAQVRRLANIYTE